LDLKVGEERRSVVGLGKAPACGRGSGGEGERVHKWEKPKVFRAEGERWGGLLLRP